MQKILVTGGAGYIGSHVAVQLLKNPEYSIVLVDSFINSSSCTISKIQEISRRKSCKCSRNPAVIRSGCAGPGAALVLKIELSSALQS